jgi:hypothetical protein
MNKYTTLLICLILLTLAERSSTQVHYPDEWWPVGSNEYSGTPGYGNAWLRFQNGIPSVQLANLNMNFEAAMAVASDTLGNLLFYSNGCEIRGADGQLLENGAGLNPGELHNWVCGQVGYTAPRSMTALPLPGNPAKWVLLHLGGEYDPSRKMVFGPLYLTEIDMAANGGQGAVTDKNVVIASGDLEPFAIVRHGNGRDWWVIMPEYGTNRYQIRLISPQGLSLASVQSIGAAVGCRRVGASTFSPDGSKYARTNSCLAVVMDFDRCAGILSDPVPLHRDPGMLGGGGLAFSPGNRWVYATTDLCIFRADLTEPLPLLDSLYKRPYAYVDEPPISQYVYGTSLTYMQTAPDGRLYMAARHRERYYPRFTIQGEDYAFEPEGFKLPVPTVRTLPHFPNFRLFDLKGSLCDTLGINGSVSTTAPLQEGFTIQFTPNPFSERVIAKMEERGLLRIFDIDGRQMISARCEKGELIIPAISWEDGLYIWQFISDNRVVEMGKLLKHLRK